MARRRRSSRTKGRLKVNVSPDLTPLINCMFLLLIFFMVATTFINPKGLSVDLPGSGSSESRATKDMNIVIEPGGIIQVNGEVTEEVKLAEKIRQVMKAENSKNVILEADRTVAHEEIVRVVDIARGEGIEGVAFAKGGQR